MKFRIWHKPTKRFTQHRIQKLSKKSKYIEDSIEIDSEYYVINKHEELFISQDGYPVFMYWEMQDSCYMEGFYPDEYIVQQCTGLKDKKGLDIYEGDVIIDERLDEVWTIQWGHTMPSFIGYNEQLGAKLLTSDLCGNDFKVIGTIFGLTEKPCKPDHNGECLICDCWLSECHLHEHVKLEK